jgi:hypothetical protein
MKKSFSLLSILQTLVKNCPSRHYQARLGRGFAKISCMSLCFRVFPDIPHPGWRSVPIRRPDVLCRPGSFSRQSAPLIHSSRVPDQTASAPNWTAILTIYRCGRLLTQIDHFFRVSAALSSNIWLTSQSVFTASVIFHSQFHNNLKFWSQGHIVSFTKWFFFPSQIFDYHSIPKSTIIADFQK